MPRKSDEQTDEGPAPEEQETQGASGPGSPQPQSAPGPQQGGGAGTGAGGDAPEPGKRTWTRGDDPKAADEELLQANRGSTGGELNQPLRRQTPSG